MYMHSTCTFTPVDAQSTLSCFTLKVLVICWRVAIPCTCLRVCHWVVNPTAGTPPYSKAVLLIFDSFTSACPAFKPCMSTYWPTTYKAGWQAYNLVDWLTYSQTGWRLQYTYMYIHCNSTLGEALYSRGFCCHCCQRWSPQRQTPLVVQCPPNREIHWAHLGNTHTHDLGHTLFCIEGN